MVGPRAALYQTKLTGFFLVETKSTLSKDPPTRFVTFEGKQWYPIDVDEGDRDNPIDVDLWALLQEQVASGHTACTKVVVSDPKVFQCGICWETLSKPVLPLCMHIFCFQCLFKWVNRGHHSCPVCRAHIAEEPIRDDAFEAELSDAIKEHLVERPGAVDDKRYSWAGIKFKSRE